MGKPAVKIKLFTISQAAESLRLKEYQLRYRLRMGKSARPILWLGGRMIFNETELRAIRGQLKTEAREAERVRFSDVDQKAAPPRD